MLSATAPSPPAGDVSMRMVLFDPVTAHPYSPATLRRRPLGGTEATVIRVAEAMDALVLQHNRENNEGRYRTPASQADPTHLVVLRDPAAALVIGGRYPRAHKMLWLHDLAGPGNDRGKHLLAYGPQLAAAGITVVCVSDYHANQVRANFMSLPATARPQVVRIYNPVDVSGAGGEPMAVDPNKLVFFSSPHKGLDHALTVFSQLRSKDRALRLYIANPGYFPSITKQWPGVVNLGAVPHHVILRHVKSALCTFYPNFIYPETFGLVLGESNALGTPVLTHGIGAAAEVLNGDGQVLAIRRGRRFAYRVFRRWPVLRPAGEAALALLGWHEPYRERIRSWQEGNRPHVSGRPEFSIANVVASWKAACDSQTVHSGVWRDT
jgi:glycosyltransferase involved in cell wall biosynthesis